MSFARYMASPISIPKHPGSTWDTRIATLADIPANSSYIWVMTDSGFHIFRNPRSARWARVVATPGMKPRWTFDGWSETPLEESEIAFEKLLSAFRVPPPTVEEMDTIILD